ncbi:MAG TPA: site-specific DNA-methyltransferase, partial [Spirochaetota bacterium]|nr:site-specific DNA-methyltransferase [Spirochaetota bacterium]
MQLKDFKEELTTVWSFPERGKWATHNAKYRGNYAPQVARNLIQRYT